jgi:vacuolar protein sorting-associated protein 35
MRFVCFLPSHSALPLYRIACCGALCVRAVLFVSDAICFCILSTDIQTFDELTHLEIFMREAKHGKSMQELYELVQYAGNILPRLYLLITVGAVYIRSKDAPAKDVLKDLVEMCRGVQHPTRGLFLRSYLAEKAKDLTPDTGNEFEGRGGTVRDSVDYIISNFVEMNKLWVRMQHQGPVRDREKREIERQELKQLVGKNLARLSQLEGVDVNLYREVVLPKVADQIVSSKDRISQQYLMEILIQVFPDEFHLATLDSLLATCAKLQSGVDIKTIIASLIDRLANFAAQQQSSASNAGSLYSGNIFETFAQHIAQVVEQYPTMPIEDKLALQVSLVNLSLKVEPDNREHLDQVLGYCAALLGKLKEAGDTSYSKPKAVQQIMRLLGIPLEALHNVLAVIALENFAHLLEFLEYSNRKRIALEIMRATISDGAKISSVDDARNLFQVCNILLTDQTDQPKDIDEEDFVEEQNVVAAVVNLFDHEQEEQLFLIYSTARKQFGQGGEKRIKFTLVPLVFRTLHLARKIKQRGDDEDTDKKGKKIFQFANETIKALAQTPGLARISFNLFLQAAQAAGACGYETIAYEFFTQAFILYEEELDDTRDQNTAITLIIGTLCNIEGFGAENYDALTTKAAQKASKLLQKRDQARAVCLCAHLFWREDNRDGKRVLECLQKSLKIANTIVESSFHVPLFIEILNRYMWFFVNKNDAVTAKYLQSLKEIITTNVDSPQADPTAAKFFENTLEAARLKRVPL